MLECTHHVEKLSDNVITDTREQSDSMHAYKHGVLGAD